MTTIITDESTSILAGPRGIGARATGGAYTYDCQQDLQDGDALLGPLILLSGTTDAIPNPHVNGNYMITGGAADAVTLGVPTAGLDDNLSLAIYSDTAHAHTVILPSAVFANGVALHGTATLAAQRGAGMKLRAYNGTWQVMQSSGVTFSA